MENPVRVEVRELVEPRGKLVEILELVESLPTDVPRSIVDLVARMSFACAYTQVTADLMDINKDMIEDLNGTIEEMQSYATANEVKIREEIRKILEAVV